FHLWGGNARGSYQSRAEPHQQSQLGALSLREVRKGLEQFQSGPELSDAFRICRAFDRLLAGEPEILHGLPAVTAPGVAAWEVAVLLLQPAAVQRLDRLRGALMQRASPLAKQGIVGDLLRERVLEDVLRLRIERLLVDEFRGGELVERGGQIRLGKLDDAA